MGLFKTIFPAPDVKFNPYELAAPVHDTPPKVIAPPLELSVRGFKFWVTGPVILMAPPVVVVILPLIPMAVDPVYVTGPVVFTVEVWVIVAALTDRLVNAVPPTAPVNVVVPDAPAIVSADAPERVLEKVMLLPEVMVLLVPVKLTGLEKEMAPTAVMLLLI